jgi:hypothetical protein
MSNGDGKSVKDKKVSLLINREEEEEEEVYVSIEDCMLFALLIVGICDIFLGKSFCVFYFASEIGKKKAILIILILGVGTLIFSVLITFSRKNIHLL